MNGVTVERTDRRTVQIRFTEQEFLNAVSVAIGGLADSHELTVTAVDVSVVKRTAGHGVKETRDVTVRLVSCAPIPESPLQAVVREMDAATERLKKLETPPDSVVTEALYLKLRQLKNDRGVPLFYPSALVGGPDYFDGEPVRVRKQS